MRRSHREGLRAQSRASKLPESFDLRAGGIRQSDEQFEQAPLVSVLIAVPTERALRVRQAESCPVNRSASHHSPHGHPEPWRRAAAHAPGSIRDGSTECTPWLLI
jgi:hypothetical protein